MAIPMNVIEPTPISYSSEEYIAIRVTDRDKYEGPYTFTPTGEDQIIEIEGLIAKENITIEAIPSNYGLITWNGSILTVS